MSRTYFACLAESTTTALRRGGTTPSAGSGETVRAKWQDMGQVSEITFAPAASSRASTPASAAALRTLRLAVIQSSMPPATRRPSSSRA